MELNYDKLFGNAAASAAAVVVFEYTHIGFIFSLVIVGTWHACS